MNNLSCSLYTCINITIHTDWLTLNFKPETKINGSIHKDISRKS